MSCHSHVMFVRLFFTLKPCFLPVDIRHTQCPRRFFFLERYFVDIYTLCGHKTTKQIYEVQIYSYIPIRVSELFVFGVFPVDTGQDRDSSQARASFCALFSICFCYFILLFSYFWGRGMILKHEV